MSKPTEEQIAKIENLMVRWQEAAKTDYILRYGIPSSSTLLDSTSYSVGGKMFHLIIGTSSAFMVDIATGIIYGNKGWLKVDRKKIIGNAYDPNFDAAVLVRDRFRYGHFENAQNGSPRQTIVRR